MLRLFLFTKVSCASVFDPGSGKFLYVLVTVPSEMTIADERGGMMEEVH